MSNSVETSTHELLELNRTINSHIPFWNQGQGGNISFKLDSGLMLIKPTGFRLDQLQRSDDFARLNYLDFKAGLVAIQNSSALDEVAKEAAYNQLISAAKTKQVSQHRASMEVGFHALLTKKFVLHFHHLNSVLLMSLKSAAAQEFRQKWSHFCIELIYYRPGWLLSEFFLENQFTQSLLLLQNHGAILQINAISEFAEFLKFDQELLAFLNSELGGTLDSTQQDVQSQIGKLKGEFLYLYPDVAIIESKLKPYLKSEYEAGRNPLWRLQNPSSTPPDLLENWQAMMYLQLANPQLAPLSTEQAEILKTLPTEIARQKQMNCETNKK